MSRVRINSYEGEMFVEKAAADPALREVTHGLLLALHALVERSVETGV